MYINKVMDLKYLFVVIGITMLGKSTASPVWTLIHDIVQNNIAGIPVIHEQTEWDFDPEAGKVRREIYERQNGHLGEGLIERLGQGNGFNQVWGKKVKKAKPDLRYYG